MREVNLGIIGGCLSHQPGMRRSKLYTSILRKRLIHENELLLNVSIAREFESTFTARLEGLLENRRIDVALVHVRSGFARNISIFENKKNDRHVFYYVSPNLFSRERASGGAWGDRPFYSRIPVFRRNIPKSTEANGDNDTSKIASPAFLFNTPPNATRVFGLSLRNLMHGAGYAAGLSGRAIKEELRALGDVIVKCKDLDIPLIVMGPSRDLENFWLDYTCQKMDREVQKLCDYSKIRYVGLQDYLSCNGEPLLLADGYHFNEEGHKCIAAKVLREIVEIV